MRETREIQPSQHARDQPLFTQLAQSLPFGGEVSRHKKHEQHFDHFHRLKHPEVHLGVASRRARSERQQQDKQQKASQQRRIDPARETSIVKEAKRRQQESCAAERHAPGELAAIERIAQRVTQAHGQDQPDPCQQVHRRQDGGIATESTPSPHKMDSVETREIERYPRRKLRLEFTRSPHDERRLEPGYWNQRNAGIAVAWLVLLMFNLLAQLIAQQPPSWFVLDLLPADAQPRERADIRQGLVQPNVARNLLRNKFALGRI